MSRIVWVCVFLAGCYPWVGQKQHARNTGDCIWHLDADGDGFGDPGTRPILQCAQPDGAVPNSADCDDTDPTRFPGATDEQCDGISSDCDAAVPDREFDGDGDGFVECEPDVDPVDWRGPQQVVGGGDCDDKDASIWPGREEVCDEIDNNCNDQINEGLADVDTDGDGHGDHRCGGDDCNDAEATIHPGAAEICGNGHDDDCDSGIDNRDFDGDTVIDAACGGTDCDDNNNARYPGAFETCDGVDNDCDWVIDDLDLDNDGHAPVACGGDDCDDQNALRYPGATEDCSAVDKDCSGFTDDVDVDGDGYSACGADCDDGDATVHPAAVELCGDSVDQDCSGDNDDRDVDRDGVRPLACGGVDCDDDNAAISPNLLEDCSTTGVDDDCSGTPEDRDADRDGVLAPACGGADCDDGALSVYPGALELCDGLDNDCNGQVDDRDVDGDGQISSTGSCGGSDCDDANPSTYIGAPELADGFDNNCDGTRDEGTVLFDDDGDGFCEAATCTDTSKQGLDCHDGNDQVSPAASELCDGVDNDCDGTIDDVDADGDGYAPVGCGGTDCDDGVFAVNPGVAEDCATVGVDDDCSGTADDLDDDRDGATALACGGLDCADSDPAIRPSAIELCGDSVDQDCSGDPDDVDADGDGDRPTACGGTDCDDGLGSVYAGALELCDTLDNDCNTVVDDRDLDQDGHISGTGGCPGDDCNDANPSTHVGAGELPDGFDNDCDGTVDEGTALFDDDGDGYCEGTNCTDGGLGGDCDDTDGTVSPAATEVCDGVDNDCVGGIDDVDVDGDGYAPQACGGSDCDDGVFAVNPGVLEDCTTGGVDDDCSGLADDLDEDSDGAVSLACGGGDCNDGDALIGPGRAEDCATVGVDDDCSGAPDDRDADFDGYVDVACGGADCDDTDLLVRPDAVERCNGADNDCNGAVDDRDIDGDGQLDEACGGTDCDDLNPFTKQGAPEVEDGEDNDCNGLPDDGTALYDDDGDGYCEAVVCTYGPLGGEDCDDGDPTLNRGQIEVCDGVDNDCDAATDELVDGDGDDYSLCDGDCDDAEGRTSPRSQEVCGDGVDNNCDGMVDDGSCLACTTTIDPSTSGGLQGALDAATVGDVICLDAGTYGPAVWGSKEVSVVGLFGPSQTLIEGGDSVPLTLSAGPGALLEGVTASASGSRTAVLIDGGAPHLVDVLARCVNGTGFDLRATAALLERTDATGCWLGLEVDMASPEAVILDSVVDGSKSWGVEMGSGTLQRSVVTRSGSEGLRATGRVQVIDSAIDDNGNQGIYVSSGAELRLISSDVRGNGDIGVRHVYGELTIVDSTLADNQSQFAGGAGLHAEGPYLLARSVDITGNIAEGDGGGMQVIDRYGSATQVVHLEDVRVVGNTSHRLGGGLHVADAAPRLDRVRLDNNSAYMGGGGLAVSEGTPLITRLSMQGNDVPDLSALYGRSSVVVLGGTTELRSIDLAGTVSVAAGELIIDGVVGQKGLTSSGGTLRLDHVQLTTSTAGVGSSGGHVELRNAVLAGNNYFAMTSTNPYDVLGQQLVASNISVVDCSHPSAAVLYASGSTSMAAIDNLIAINNNAGSNPVIRTTASTTIEHSDLWNNTPSDGASSTLAADPEFLDLAGSADGWDLHLAPSSPAVDFGDPALLDPDGSRSDMGAFGGPGADGWDLDGDGYFSWWQPGAYDSATYPAAGWDCNDQDETVHPDAMDLAGDGIDSDCDGLDDFVCIGVGPGTGAVGGLAECAATWDVWTIPVTAGDCVHLAVDNGFDAADLVLEVTDPDTTVATFDNEAPCFEPAWNGNSCPEAAVIAGGTGTLTLRVGQVDGASCTDLSLYTLTAAVNGVEVRPTQVGDDLP